MNSQEFYLWLNGYLEALESEGIDTCKIKNVREKMANVKKGQERIVFGPNVNTQHQPNYGKPTPPTPTSLR
tara:strand:+ start:1995 stop:2207 length:213 start_codon:yes stop_codon:yes gene_type:complete